MNLESVLNRADVWRGGDTAPALNQTSIPTGFEALDQLLPGGGWPAGTITEILSGQEGIGALSLMLPALARLSRSDRWLAWVAPPYIPYAPALAAGGIDLSHMLFIRPRANTDKLWAVEQALRSGTCGAVLTWLGDADTTTLRRLQLAAEAGGSCGLLFRPERTIRQASPAPLRLHLEPGVDGLTVNVIKRRGGWAAGPLQLDLDHALARHSSARFNPGSVHPGWYHQ
jgi:hypothetical protein